MGPITRTESLDTQHSSPQHVTFIDLLNALSEYRMAETSMMRRTRSIMDRGATDALALRYIKEAAAGGEGLRPTELASRLGLRSASVTALVDRLVDSGAVKREPHPMDRRAVILTPTNQPEATDLRALDDARQPLAQVVQSLSQEELTTVMNFLHEMSAAMHEMAKTD